MHNQDFVERERTNLLFEITYMHIDHKRRRLIGDRLAKLGDTRSGIGLNKYGFPDIEWLPVSLGGEIEIEDNHFTIQPFYVAKYLITSIQFESFIDDTFEDKSWWSGFPEKFARSELSAAIAPYYNYPRDSISWYEAVAFSRWMDHKYRASGLFKQFAFENYQIRLPTEWEWQWMAQNGAEARKYPWGSWDQYPRANTNEEGIGDSSTAVGMYPQGCAECGAFDVSGNLFEWCLNNYESLTITRVQNSELKTLRGGCFSYDRYYAASNSRSSSFPNFSFPTYGLRLVVAPQIKIDS